MANIFCINRKERVDKFQWALSQFEKQNITVTFLGAKNDSQQIDFIQTKDLKQRGKFLSHAHLWKQLADDERSDCYFIFEDDVAFVENFASHITALTKFVSTDDSPTVICLGYFAPGTNILGPVEEVSVIPVRSFIATWGYVINKQAAKLLLGSKTTHLPVDYFLFSKLDKIKLMTPNKTLCIPNLSLGSDVNPPEFTKLKLEIGRGMIPDYPF